MAQKLKPKDINFYLSYKDYISSGRGKKGSNKMVIMILLVAVIMVAVYGYFRFSLYSINNDIVAVNAYIQDPVEKNAYQEALAAETKVLDLQSKKNNLDMIAKSFSSFKVMDEEDFLLIDLCNGGHITVNTMLFDKNTAYLEIAAAANNVNSIPIYISDLKKTGLFSNILYEGYSLNEDNKYGFKVMCRLKVVN